MKIPQTSAGRLNGVTAVLNPSYRDAFCRHLADCLIYLRDQGCGTPIHVTPQNEPTWVVDYEGCSYSHDPALYQSILKSLRKELDDGGLGGVLIAAAEGNHAGNNGDMLGWEYAALANDDALQRAVGAGSVHSYDQWGISLYPLLAINEINFRYGKELWMTEWSEPHGATELDWTLNTFGHMNRELTTSWIQYWFWWTAYSRVQWSANNQVLVYGDNSNVRCSKLYWAFQKLWQKVPGNGGYYVKRFASNDPEMVGHYDWNNQGTSSGDRQCQMIAFENGTQSVIVIINPYNHDKWINLQWLPNGRRYNRFETNASEDMSNKGTITVSGLRASFNAPPRSLHLLSTH